MSTAQAIAKCTKVALLIAWVSCVLSVTGLIGGRYLYPGAQKGMEADSMRLDSLMSRAVELFFFAFWTGLIATTTGLVLRFAHYKVLLPWLFVGMMHVVCSLAVIIFVAYVVRHRL